MNNAIITVVGSDQVGIIARVSAYLSEKKVNIVDITQTILSGNFVMMMMVDLSQSAITIADLRTDMNKVGESMGVEINIMHERVFGAMHRV
ncbi:MAG: ACT domain-containing protein [Treponemataceae bacterium]|nr:ACT domain-containing protein [Treponemataceae bacterium]